MFSRTIMDFTVANVEDTLKTIKEWAHQNNYHLKKSSYSWQLFQKGTGFLVAPMMLEISYNGLTFHLEAWVRATLLARLGALFLIPAEIGIESEGFKMAIPKKIAREAVNKLLDQLGQPSIP